MRKTQEKIDKYAILKYITSTSEMRAVIYSTIKDNKPIRDQIISKVIDFIDDSIKYSVEDIQHFRKKYNQILAKYPDIITLEGKTYNQIISIVECDERYSCLKTKIEKNHNGFVRRMKSSLKEFFDTDGERLLDISAIIKAGLLDG